MLLHILGASKFDYRQTYLLSNEKLIFSFRTENNKKMVLAKDSTNKYIVYRFGSNDRIEFEFPGMNKTSWKKFTYSFYLRGGGKENEGLDLNYVFFSSTHYKYIIYHTYSAEDEKYTCGIKVLDITTKKTVNIKGNAATIEGNLIDFRDNKLLEIGDETFD